MNKTRFNSLSCLIQFKLTEDLIKQFFNCHVFRLATTGGLQLSSNSYIEVMCIILLLTDRYSADILVILKHSFDICNKLSSKSRVQYY